VGAALDEIGRVLKDAALDHRIVETTHPGHATQVARDALRGGERYLVAVGGDGTVHEVVNGMLEDGEPVAADAVLGVVAAGSGCDFVRSFDIPGDAAQAASHLAGDAVRQIDVGRVTYAAGGGQASRYFPNIAQVGLGGLVADRAARLPALLGPIRYFAGFWLVLPGSRPATVTLEADGQAYEWRVNNLVVANCQFYGGGMRISPKSEPDDGALDVLAMVGPKSDAFTIVPKVYKGTHLPHRGIVELRASLIQVEADAPLAIEADGEMLGTTPARFEIIRKAIQLKV
jgi:YegS/Rv2252/BmrU family lipid kinase